MGENGEVRIYKLVCQACGESRWSGRALWVHLVVEHRLAPEDAYEEVRLAMENSDRWAAGPGG